MRRVVVVMLLAPLAAGCVKRGKGLDDVKREVAARSSAPVRWDSGSKEDEQVRDHVRTLLRSEIGPDTAVEIALLNNRRIQAVYEELGIAQADLVEAGLLANPVLGGGVRFAERGSMLPSFSIAHEILSLLTLPSRKKLARAEWEQRKLLVAHAVLELAAETKLAWFEAKSAELVLAMRKEVASAGRAGADLSARQYDAGNISDLTLALEEERAEEARLDLAEAEGEVIATRERLNRLLGVWGADTDWRLAAEMPALPASEPDLAHLERAAIERRLDLAADRHGAAIVARALGTTRAWRFVPGLEVGFEVEKEDDGVYHSGPHVSLQLPLFDWGQTRVARLEAQSRQAQNELVARAIDVRSEVREGRDRLVRSRARVEYFRDTLLPLRERIVRLTQLRYNAMLLGVYDVLRAKENQIDTYRSFIEANRDYWIARTELERAAGGSLEHTDTSLQEGAAK